MKKIKNLILTLVAASGLIMPVLAPVVVHAQGGAVGGGVSADPKGSFSCGTNIDINSEGCAVADTGARNKVNDTIKLAINLFSAIVGIISVVMIIVGGIKYITSGGDSGNVTSAKNTILYAVIGLVVVALAQIIVKFVLDRFTQ